MLTSINRDLLWDAASEPGCKNSFDIENIAQLPSTSMDIAMRLCEARSTELWVGNSNSLLYTFKAF